MWNRQGLLPKIMLLFICSTIVFTSASIFLNRLAIEETAEKGMLGKSRAIIAEAFSTLEYTADLREKYRVFNDDTLRDQVMRHMASQNLETIEDRLQAVRETTFYWTIPVVSAWSVARKRAEESGYEFRTPRIGARNPLNEADSLEQEMFALLEAGEKEVFRYDLENNKYRYMAPVYLSDHCLVCHGTAEHDDDGDGIDAVGFKMEGQKTGDLYGAFEVMIDLTEVQEEVLASTWRIIITTLVLLVITLLLVYLLIKKSVLNPVQLVLNSLLNMSQQTRSASENVSSLSQNLADSASTQAASLEETSSTMTQMEEQTRENAQNSGTAVLMVKKMGELVRQTTSNAQVTASLSEEARATVEDGASTMSEIAESMHEISDVSGKITSIIQVIDEITHQTKMLATNAAIEAARAGEHGKGFAVVADEVSKLAENSKQAAREIATLIHESETKAQAGTNRANRGETALKLILEKFIKVSDLVEEISSVSQEQSTQMDSVEHLIESIQSASWQQSDGVEQVAKSITQMDMITQNNASTAEENAASAEELSGQAGLLQSQVTLLSAQVNGKRRAADMLKDPSSENVVDELAVSAPEYSKPMVLKPKPAAPPQISSFELPAVEKEKQSSPPQGKVKKVSASDIIPMRDDFSEF